MTNFEQFKAELDAVCKKFGVGLGIRGEDAEQWVTAFDRIDAQCVWFGPRVEDWPEANEPYVQPDVSEPAKDFESWYDSEYTIVTHRSLSMSKKDCARAAWDAAKGGEAPDVSEQVEGVMEMVERYTAAMCKVATDDGEVRECAESDAYSLKFAIRAKLINLLRGVK